jgi:hypothetical protein
MSSWKYLLLSCDYDQTLFMSAVILAGVVISGAWTQLDEIGWAGWLALALVAVFDHYGPALDWRRPRPSLPLDRTPLAASALICAFLLAHVALTWREEFGFSGDEGYHLSATRTVALYFMRAGPLLAVVLALYVVLLFNGVRYAATAAMAGLLAVSYVLPHATLLFGRYPAGFYMLATPLNVIFEVLNSPYPHTANHVMNVLSVPVWLFVLRPLVIGRWPDWQVLPVVLLIYFQAPALVYLGSALVEPWSILLLLLSVEALVALPADQRWVAVVLASIAAVFKETAILLLPTIWIVASVEWRGRRPSLGANAIPLGVAAIIPFLLYYLVRRDAEVHRIVAVATAAELLQPARLTEWLTNVSAALGVTAVAGVALLFVGTLRQVAWSLTTLALVTFFFVDALGVPYTGYSRYLAFALVALSGAVFAALHRTTDRRLLIGVPLLMAALQAWPVARTFALDFRPDYERNSLEWKGGLIRLPIRSLVGKLPSLGGDTPARIRVVAFATDLISLPVVYPDLAAQYELRPENYAASSEACSCRDNDEAVLAAFEWPAHFDDTPEQRVAFHARSSSCVQQIEATCRAFEVERDRGGAAVGVIGAGVR